MAGYMAKKNKLKTLLYAELEPLMSKHGFNPIRSKIFPDQPSFGRESSDGDIMHHYAFDFYREGAGFIIRPAILVTSKALDEIYFNFTKIKSDEREDHYAMAFELWRIFGRSKREQFECKLLTEKDIKAATRSLSSLFEKYALPFYKKVKSVAVIDHIFNKQKKPEGFWYLQAFWDRVLYATIAAKIAKNPDFTKRVKYYKSEILDSDFRDSLPKYERLVASLKT